jgi:6-phosphogluconolactonase
VHLLWGVERCVPPEHPESNYRMAREALIDRIPIPPGNVHRLRGELPPAEAAAEYARQLAAFPRIDLALLGLGAEGHTASLFPGSPALDAAGPVEAVFVPKLQAWRVTLTPRALSAAGGVIFVVAGREKAEAVRAVLAGPFDPRRLPAQAVRAEQVVWLLDREAAEGIDGGVGVGRDREAPRDAPAPGAGGVSMALSAEDLSERLRGLPDWEGGVDGIRKTFRLPGFRAAVAFVGAVAEAAEEMDHHPDIDIRYDRVTLFLVTHDAGGVTLRDVELARRADEAAGRAGGGGP